MNLELKTSIIEDIEQCVQRGMLDQLALLLAHYEGDDLGHQFQRAFRLCIEQGNIQFFTQFYLVGRSAKKALPDQKLLMRAVAHTISIYKNDLNEAPPFKQLVPEVLRALFEMLVWQQMVKEFLEFYQDLKRIHPLPPMSDPDSSTWYAAISIIEQQIKYAPAVPNEHVEELHRLRKLIKSITNL